MIVPFSAADFLDRALAVYADRIGIVDEPDQPAEWLPIPHPVLAPRTSGFAVGVRHHRTDARRLPRRGNGPLSRVPLRGGSV